MNPSSPRSASGAHRPEPRPISSSPSEDAFHVPPTERDDDGPDVTAQPGAEAGHYGMGYGDPTRHQGGTQPTGTWPTEGTSLPPGAQQAAPRPDGQMTQDAPAGRGGTGPTGDKGGGQQ